MLKISSYARHSIHTEGPEGHGTTNAHPIKEQYQPTISAAFPFLGVWLLYSGYIIWRRHEKRRLQAIRVGILTATLVGIAALHFYYYTSARAAGEYAERLVRAYKAQHGTYPDTLEEAGWTLGAYGGRWRIVYQGYGADKDPILMHPATWVIFDMYDYDFNTGQWAYLPD